MLSFMQMNPLLTRRSFLSSTVLCSTANAIGTAETATDHRPKPPFRVWYQPRLFHRDMSLYAGMTLDASGWLAPKLAALAGKTGLRWAYGTNLPDANGPAYWLDMCRHSESKPGIAIDEWVPSKNPSMEGWAAEGLRAGRKSAPDIFIAVWVTDPTPVLASLVTDGTVDLVIAETYTHAAAKWGRDATLHWDTTLRRMDAAQQLGMGEKTIFCFGHISPDKDIKGRALDPGWITERAHEIKERYPKAPGIAFYQDDSPDDSKSFRELVRHCDALSTKLWPDTGPAQR